MPAILQLRRPPARRALLRAAALMSVLAVARVASAQERVKLFKVIGAKDEVTIGLTEGELRAMGTGEDVQILARRLVADGQFTVWQYAVTRDASGGLQQGPLRHIAILRNDAIRIEPYPTPLKIVPPKP